MGAVYHGRSAGSFSQLSSVLWLWGGWGEGAEEEGVLIKNPQSRFVAVVLSHKPHRDGLLLFVKRFHPVPLGAGH